MNETERVKEWAASYGASLMKFNVLKSVLANDGERMLEKVLLNLGLRTALDVVKKCPDEPFRHFQK